MGHNCVFTIEMDSCLVNNGGCDENAICMKTGPNRVCVLSLTTNVNIMKSLLRCWAIHLLLHLCQVACACRPGFISQGHRCLAVNPCRKVTDFEDLWLIMAKSSSHMQCLCMQNIFFFRITGAAMLMLFADTSVLGNVIAHAILASKGMVFSVQGLSVELVSFKNTILR